MGRRSVNSTPMCYLSFEQSYNKWTLIEIRFEVSIESLFLWKRAGKSVNRHRIIEVLKVGFE